MEKLTKLYAGAPIVKKLSSFLQRSPARIKLKGFSGSLPGVLAAALDTQRKESVQLFVLPTKEEAGYFYNDLLFLLEEQKLETSKRSILFYPASYKQPYQIEQTDNANVLLRSEVLNKLGSQSNALVVTYPDALTEKVISQQNLRQNTLKIHLNEQLSDDFVLDVLNEYEFERVDFVIEPGQYSLRGGIVDVFSFASEYPFRIEFFGENVESLRTFDSVTQLSIEKCEEIVIIPNIQNERITQKTNVDFVSYLKDTALVWFQDLPHFFNRVETNFEKAKSIYATLGNEIKHSTPEQLYTSASDFSKSLTGFSTIEFGITEFFKEAEVLTANTSPQPVFNKQFEMLIANLDQHAEQSYINYICVDNPKQVQRLEKVFSSISQKDKQLQYEILPISLNEGFIDHDEKVLCYTEHQIFERYHRYTLNDLKSNREALTLKELSELEPGDFITHIDHGIGRFGGLEKIENNGKIQEAIRLIYKDNDVLYVNIHSLHRISRYVGKEGSAPSLNRLGSNTWQVLKNKTKQKVKDIAKDLIKLYAARKNSEGFAFSADSYLQNELEASFVYEDTPDQYKSTNDVKRDMEASAPMDRLVCGDVGFGKTEVAIRAAFKAVADSKQVAVLVPTTILALQHYNTFSERLKDFPCRIEYLNRFRSAKDKTAILKDLEAGKIDILIGTHLIASQTTKFKDLGLLIVDEEQKFGVAIKERLKQIKVNVDTLTLTATPIPRTLQFSLMGARDLSVITTPPTNRYPVHTELQPFNEDVIRDAIMYELSRGGQVYFIHNRVQSIMELAGMLQRLLPDARIGVGHGQMEGKKLENILLQFVEGDLDILLATTIVENGLDIPNANTIIINDAQNFGLSELHQLRGRVGRSNKKSYCYLLAPSFSVLTDEARKRLRAIEEFSAIGSGFNIAMRDLDIRGAGNILGAEQSGFISEIGFDMYQKILNEAMEELKEYDFKELYAEENAEKKTFVNDCVIETDLEILIPDSYVSNITERLILYKELDNLESDEDLAAYRSRLTDRFGAVPPQTQELIETIKLRNLAKKLGFEKLVLKQNKLIGYFVANPNSGFYQSATFTSILSFLQHNTKRCRMQEKRDKLSLTIDYVKTVGEALQLLLKMTTEATV